MNPSVVGQITLVLDTSFEFVLNNCLFVPTLIKNLISILILDKESFSVEISNSICIISMDKNVIGHGELINSLCKLKLNEMPINVSSNKRKDNTLNPTILGNFRLGHISLKRMKELVDEGLFSSTDMSLLASVPQEL